MCFYKREASHTFTIKDFEFIGMPIFYSIIGGSCYLCWNAVNFLHYTFRFYFQLIQFTGIPRLIHIWFFIRNITVLLTNLSKAHSCTKYLHCARVPDNALRYYKFTIQFVSPIQPPIYKLYILSKNYAIRTPPSRPLSSPITSCFSSSFHPRRSCCCPIPNT